MTRKAKYFQEVERLLDNGLEPKQIIKVTGIPESTVYWVRKKLREEARLDFKELMSEDYIWKYQKTLENYSKTIQQMNEAIAEAKAKYADKEAELREELAGIPSDKYIARATILQAIVAIEGQKNQDLVKLTAQRDKATEAKAKTYNQGPVVHAVDEWLRTGNANQPEIEALNTTVSTNPIPETPKPLPQAPTDDDIEIMRKMDEESTTS